MARAEISAAPQLSEREQQIAKLYVAGHSYKEIARVLALSPATVRTHLNNVFRKLEVANRIQLLHRLGGQVPDPAQSAAPATQPAASPRTETEQLTSAPTDPTQSRTERRLAAILAADVAGYSRLMERDEAGTVARLKSVRQELIEPVLARHGGRFVDLKGDGAIVEFASAVAAVEAAVEIQRAMAVREADRPEAERIRYRIGINLGDVVVDGHDIYGDGVNVAARIESLCEPGGIWVAARVYDPVKGKLDVPFEPAGRHWVKNIGEPIETFRIRLEGGPARRRLAGLRLPRRATLAAAAALLLTVVGASGWWWHEGQSQTATTAEPEPLDRPTIAVLPFDDLSGEERQQRLADGFTEDLITELARSRELVVIARNSVEAFKGKPTDVREIGRRLGAGYILEGSLELQPSRLRVTAQLIDASKGAHLWTERYDRPPDDLFAIRDEVLTRLAGTLTGHDGPIWVSWTKAARHRPTESLGAWDYYLMAKAPYGRHDKEGNAEARQLLEKAVELDPNFARAWAWLAVTHGEDWLNGWIGDRAESIRLMRRAGERAVALDPNDGFAHFVLTGAYFTSEQYELARQAFERALALAPNDALVVRLVGNNLPIAFGVERAEEGLRLVERALGELDPLHPPFQYISLAIPLYFAGRYSEAVAALDRIPEPWLEARVMLALSCAQAGLQERAREQMAELRKLEPGFSAEAWVDNDIYQPGGSSARLFFDGARKAGLPLCAPANEAARLAPLNRLPECDAERARQLGP